MSNFEETITVDGVQHPKSDFDEGHTSGTQGKAAQKSLVQWGLKHHEDPKDIQSAKAWLAGFERGYQLFLTNLKRELQ